MEPLTFEEATHEYRHSGVIVPSVTQILSATGICRLPNISWVTLERARKRGRAVHLASEFLDKGILDWSSLDEEIAACTRAYEQFKKDYGFKVQLSEFQVLIVVGAKKCAGRLDRVGLIQGKPYVLDLKTTAQEMASWRLQTAGYALGLPPVTRKPFFYGRASLRLLKSGKYKFTEYTDHQGDSDTFRAILLGGAEHPAVKAWRINQGVSEDPEIEA